MYHTLSLLSLNALVTNNINCESSAALNIIFRLDLIHAAFRNVGTIEAIIMIKPNHFRTLILRPVLSYAVNRNESLNIF